MKNILNWTKAGEKKKAEEMYAQTQKAIDLCAKNNLIHKNNAAHKKSLITRAMNAAGAKIGVAAKVPAKSGGKKKTATSKAEKAAA